MTNTEQPDWDGDFDSWLAKFDDLDPSDVVLAQPPATPNDDALMQWELMFVTLNQDFEQTVNDHRARFIELRDKRKRTKADNDELTGLSAVIYMWPLIELACRLCEATNPIEGEATMTYEAAGRGWALFDASVVGYVKKVKHKSGDEEGVKLWRQAVAEAVYKKTKLSLYNERDRALAAWAKRSHPSKSEPLDLPPARAFPEATIMAVAEGTMTAEEAADEWLAGGEPH